MSPIKHRAEGTSPSASRSPAAGVNPTRPKSLAARESRGFISRPPTCSGAGPSPGAASLRTLAPRSRSRGNAHGVSRPSPPADRRPENPRAGGTSPPACVASPAAGVNPTRPKSLAARESRGSVSKGAYGFRGGSLPGAAYLRTLALRSRSRSSRHGFPALRLPPDAPIKPESGRDKPSRSRVLVEAAGVEPASGNVSQGSIYARSRFPFLSLSAIGAGNTAFR